MSQPERSQPGESHPERPHPEESHPEDPAAWRTERDDAMAALTTLPAGDPRARELCGRAGELSYLLYREQEDPEDLALAAEAFAHAFRGRGEGSPGSGRPLWQIMYGHILALRYDEAPDPDLLAEVHELLARGLSALPEDPDFEGAALLARRLLAVTAKLRYLAAEDDRELLDEALHRNLSALDDIDGADPDLQETLGYLWLRHGVLGGGAASYAHSARYYGAVLAEPGPASDLPLVRHSRAMSLTFQGYTETDRRLLEEAREESAAALADARGRGGDPPEWRRDAELRITFIRTVIAVTWDDEAQGALAEADLAVMAAAPQDMDALAESQLDVFGRLLSLRGIAQDSPKLLDHGIELLTRALDRWQPERDGKPTRPALALAVAQSMRHDSAADPERLRAAVRALRLALADEELTGEERDHGMMLLMDAQRQLPGDGPTDVPVEEVARLDREFRASVMEGNPLDFGTDNRLLADTPEARARWELRFAPVFEQWRATEPDGLRRAEGAAQLLVTMSMLDPHRDRLGEAREEELTQSVLRYCEDHPEWRGRGYAALGGWRLNQGMAGSAARLAEAQAYFAAAREAGGDRAWTSYGERMAAGMHEQLTGITGGFATAVEDWAEMREALGLSPRLQAMWVCQQASAQTIVAAKRGDLAAADSGLAEVAEAVSALPRDDPAFIEVWTQWETARLAREDLADRVGAPASRPPAARPSIAELKRMAATYPRQDRADLLGNNALARSRDALRAHDIPRVRGVLALTEEACALSAEGSDPWMRFSAEAGHLYYGLAMNAPDPRSRERAQDLERSITLLQRAVDAMGGPEHRLWAFTAFPLGCAYRARGNAARGDREAARRYGIDSLRGYVWAALLQSGTHDAAEAARMAGENSEEVVRWCLADGCLEEAVQALDACRGLVLHAATTSRSVPELLAAADREDLAERWRRASAEADSVPSALRREVIAALTGEGGTLLDPPGAAEIGERLRALRKDALVYLVPASLYGPGSALVVTAQGDIHAVPLPRLTEDAAPLREYAPGGRTGRDLGPVPGWEAPASAPAPVPAPLREQLDRLCSWAWYAAVRPLFDLFAVPDRPGRVARLVLLPMGALGLVPWHAAWNDDGTGRRRHAIEEAEISYAPSARLLCEVAARPPAPHTATALIVGNPTGDLHYAGEEADAVHRAFYPDGRLLGLSTGDGTPQEVAEWLRRDSDDGAVLHLACHGTVAENRPRSSYLSLKGGELTAEELTDSLPGRLGLVVLAACRSQVSGRGHNEAYSLASAFLVAGTRSVIGSLWPVPDEATSVLMFMTHHFLRREQEPPARALRRAQLWVLDPARTVPAELPPVLAERLADLDPRDLSAWAGFTHLGQ
ncbi:CHAT domain-containing protein [Streptomyces sp. ISL-86]|uniref:CHAT domain-containing protein n=1 Tax=Streptomyces sp. ISL-86 TaxID=2819187 RepID=UPI002553256F|nr:CHAT domain-containing protein [Streptomyces sp. ISL-86]